MVTRTIPEVVSCIAEWLEKNVCKHITLKIPDEINPSTGMSKMKLVHPAAFPMFVPGKDQLPPAVQAPAPSLVVQMMEGEDKIRDGVRSLQIRVSLCAWNPGIHDQEIMVPRPSDSPAGRTYFRTSAENDNAFRQSMDGWKDAWLFADAVLKELENREFIEDMRIVFDENIKFGPFKTDDMIWDQYPYWSCFVSFTLEIPHVVGPSTSIIDFL